MPLSLTTPTPRPLPSHGRRWIVYFRVVRATGEVWAVFPEIPGDRANPFASLATDGRVWFYVDPIHHDKKRLRKAFPNEYFDLCNVLHTAGLKMSIRGHANTPQHAYREAWYKTWINTKPG